MTAPLVEQGGHHTDHAGRVEHMASAQATRFHSLEELVAFITRVLSEVREQRRPGYLLLPIDVARFETERPTAPLPRYTGGTSPRALALFKEAAKELIADQRLTAG